MRHVVVDEWSRGDSILHRRDARAKLAALFMFLISVALNPSPELLAAITSAIVLAIVIARIPPGGVLLRAAVVLPFSGMLALFSGSPVLLVKSSLSALCVIVLAATTPMPQILNGMRQMGLPAFLAETIQLVYRYLFVLAERLIECATRQQPAAAIAAFVRWLGRWACCSPDHINGQRAFIERCLRGYSGESRVLSHSNPGPADAGLIAFCALTVWIGWIAGR